MGDVNHKLQLAAALDRRGITATVEWQQVIVRIGSNLKSMTIRYAVHGPLRWVWSYLGRDGTYPGGDFEGAAEAIEAFLRALPGMAGTELLYRMDHIGMTWRQETEEALARAEANRPS